MCSVSLGSFLSQASSSGLLCVRSSEHCTQIFVSCCSGKSFSRFRSLTSCEGEFPQDECERDDKMYSSLNFEREFSSVVFVLWPGLCILY